MLFSKFPMKVIARIILVRVHDAWLLTGLKMRPQSGLYIKYSPPWWQLAQAPLRNPGCVTQEVNTPAPPLQRSQGSAWTDQTRWTHPASWFSLRESKRGRWSSPVRRTRAKSRRRWIGWARKCALTRTLSTPSRAASAALPWIAPQVGLLSHIGSTFRVAPRKVHVSFPICIFLAYLKSINFDFNMEKIGWLISITSAR